MTTVVDIQDAVRSVIVGLIDMKNCRRNLITAAEVRKFINEISENMHQSVDELPPELLDFLEEAERLTILKEAERFAILEKSDVKVVDIDDFHKILKNVGK